MEKEIKILKILNSDDSGGIYTCETQYIKNLTSRGVKVDVIIIGNGNKKETYARIANKAHFLPALGVDYSGSPLKRLLGIYKTYVYGRNHSEYLKRELDIDYSAIIYRRPVFLFLAGMISKYLSVSAYWHMPGTVNSSFSKKFYTFFCKKYKIIPIANSQYTKSTLGEICEYVVYPGYDESRVVISKPFFKENLGIGDGSVVYGMVARVCYDKAQDLLIQAFVQSKIAKSNGHLLIAGGAKDPDFLAKIKEYSGNLLEKQIHFLGEISNLSEFYSSIDVAVNSRRNEEAFGISVAEALGAGKPVVAYRLGGPSEMIDNGINGWLIDSPTLENYLEVLNKSFESRDSWHDIGEEGKKRSEKYMVETNVTKLLSIVAHV